MVVTLTVQTCNGCSSAEPTLNISVDSGLLEKSTVPFKPLLSANAFFHSMTSLSSTLVITATIGIMCNILILSTYLKMGFSDSINISYFALGISDLGVLVTTVWGALCNLFNLTRVELPFNAMEISSPTMYWPGEGFEKTTTCITAYIALERCLCVLFPLHVKTFVTRRNTGIVIGAIFVLVFIPSNLGSLGYSFVWEVRAGGNKTILRTVLTGNPPRAMIKRIMEVYVSTVVHFTAMVAIWLCTAFLAAALKQNLKSRETTFGQAVTTASQIRNTRVIKTVLLIAVAYLCFSTPRSACNLVRNFEPQFMVRGAYYRIYMLSIVVCVQMSIFNSSINIFIYIYMSSKFREILQRLLCSCFAPLEKTISKK